MVFSTTDYRKIIAERVESHKVEGKAVNFQRVAEATAIPASYLSRVMRGAADFSGDQLYKVAAYLRFSDEEQDYLQLLLEYERSQLSKRKRLLKSRIKTIQAQKLEAGRYIAANPIDPDQDGTHEYFYNPIHQVVHIALSIPRYQSDPDLLQRDLGISKLATQRSIETLERLGFISRDGETIRVVVWNYHLPRSSSVYETWRDQTRLHSMHRLKNLDGRSSYSFSVTFNADEAVRLSIQAKFMEFLATIKPTVDAAKDEDCYQLNFDLFRWTLPETS